MLGVDSVNPVAGLVIVDVDVDCDVDVAVTGGIGVVADYDCVVLVILIGVLGRVIPVVEPLILVTLAAATATAVGEVDVLNPELVLEVPVFVKEGDVEVVAAVVGRGPVHAEPVVGGPVYRELAEDPVDPVASLILENFNHDVDVDFTIALGIGVEGDVDGVVFEIAVRIFGFVVPVLEPLVVVCAGTAVGVEAAVLQQVAALFLVDVMGVVTLRKVVGDKEVVVTPVLVIGGAVVDHGTVFVEYFNVRVILAAIALRYEYHKVVPVVGSVPILDYADMANGVGVIDDRVAALTRQLLATD